MPFSISAFLNVFLVAVIAVLLSKHRQNYSRENESTTTLSRGGTSLNNNLTISWSVDSINVVLGRRRADGERGDQLPIQLNGTLVSRHKAKWTDIIHKNHFGINWSRLTVQLVDTASQRLHLTVNAATDNGVDCYAFDWRYLSESGRSRDLIDCFSIPAGSHWYGGPEVLEQRWPIDDQRSELQPHETGDFLSPQWRHRPTYGKYGSIAEPYWVTSSGVGVYVANGGGVSGLRSAFNEEGRKQLCLGPNSDWKEDEEEGEVTFTYHICRGDNVLEVHQAMLARFIPRPVGIPDVSMIRHPIWTTWVRYKVNVNQSSVMELATDIKKYQFGHAGQIEIDDRYTSEYGQFDFDPVKFPDAKTMIDQLHDMGFRVTTWVHPFANLRSAAMLEGTTDAHWIADSGFPYSYVPALTRWWQGIGCILDVTNPDAVTWYRNRLRQFQLTHNIDSFKFDAGEMAFVPTHRRRRAQSVTPSHQNDFSNLYAKMAAEFGRSIEIRSAFGNQDLPVFVRMLDKDSVWTHKNGLRSIIPTALMLGLSGYPFILPDIIGGNGYILDDVTSGVDHMPASLMTSIIPDRELYIRWTELTAFLPAMQFSLVPWQFDAETVDIARKYAIELRQSLVNEHIERAANESVLTGYPIIRPLWWLDPSDEDSLNCDSEFLIGDRLLVAPIVYEGARSRDVYIPGPKDNFWRQLLPATTERTLVSGRTWIRGLLVQLDEIAVFERQ